MQKTVWNKYRKKTILISQLLEQNLSGLDNKIFKKRNYVKKTVGKPMHINGSVVTSQEDILTEIFCFIKTYSCYDKELQEVEIKSTDDKNYIRVLDENMSNN